MTSYLFAGDDTSYMSIASSADTRMGTGDFTIEWYQYETDNNSYPRIFQIGNYPSTSIGVSIEGGTFYFWNNSSYEYSGLTSYKDIWVHFAIVRHSGQTTVYKDGAVLISSFSDTTDYNSIEDLLIGNETNRSADASFGGYLAYFHIIKGTAKYTSTFTVSNTYPDVIADTVYLLKTTGNVGNNITVVGVNTVSQLPSGFIAEEEPPAQTIPPRPTKSAYGNNALIFYAPHTLSASISAGVRNNRAVSRRT